MTEPVPPDVECEQQHPSLAVADVRAAVAFYTATLGSRLAFRRALNPHTPCTPGSPMIRHSPLAGLVFLLACAPASPDLDASRAAVREDIANTMQRYQVAARTVDPDSIAAFYAPNAILFEPGINPIRTRDSIRAFIASFPGVRVDVATATPDTIEVFGGTAYLWGSYFERLAFPGQPLSEQHGKFVVEWKRQPDGGWQIQRMFRVPVPTPPSATASPAP